MILRDITERKKRQKEIQEYQEMLRKMTVELSHIEEKQRKEIAANIHDHLNQQLLASKMKLAVTRNLNERE